MAFDGEIYEIFSWLPATPLFKFSSVAKPCLEFLSEPGFIEKQCNNLLSKPEDGFFFEKNYSKRDKLQENLEFYTLPENTFSSRGIIPFNSLKFLRRGRVLASSNGLLLCRTVGCRKPIKLFLCNPTMKTWLNIKLPGKKMAKEFRENKDINVIFTCGSNKSKSFPLDYTLVLFELQDTTSDDWSSNGFKVYMLEEGKWVIKEKKLNVGGRSLNFHGSVHCKDGLYFMSDCGSFSSNAHDPCYWPYVFCYDICGGKSRFLPLPDEACENFMYSDMNIFGWRRISTAAISSFNSICLVKSMGSMLTVWVLEDTQDPKSWWRLLKVDISEDMGIKDCIKSTVSFTIIGNNLIFATNSYIYRYFLEGNLKDDGGKFEEICQNTWGRSNEVLFHPYSSTLRPCSKNWIQLPRKIR